MKRPEKTLNEAQRLESLKRLEILDTPAEDRFDRITRLARRALNTEIALISLVDAERQWFKSAQGLAETETSRDISFCGHAIQHEEAFVVPDASKDERFADNPLVTTGPHVRFYAGQPVRSPEGFLVGTLCVLDSEPREMSPAELEALQDLAALVEKELRIDELGESELRLRERLAEVERKAAIDPLTRLWTRSIIEEVLEREYDRSVREGFYMAVAMIDVDRFKQINDQHGHLVGDEVLKRVADRIRRALRPYDSVGRFGGEEFMAVLTNCDPEEALRVSDRIRRFVSDAPVEAADRTLEVTVSVGVCARVARSSADPKEVIGAADRALLRAKRGGRNRVEGSAA